MKKIINIILLMFFVLVSVKATHNRAGEITYRQISALTYEITITTFTYTISAADRNQLEVFWGDNTFSVAPRVERTLLPDFYQRNIYKAQHTYPGPGTYEMFVQDPNRNLGVKNIPNSVNVVFSITTKLVINPNIGFNNTPVLLNYPIDKAGLGQVFIHNPAAYDPDGDSLSYSLTVCTGEDGIPIDNYEFPEASRSLTVDSITGDLVWDAPVEEGIYNVAMNVTEYRNGVMIGNIVRDMQIEVLETNNAPPENEPLPDFCVVAGDSVYFEFISRDEDADPLKQSALGGPLVLEDSPATFTRNSYGPGFSESIFEWITTCSHVRKEPYYVVLKSEDANLIQGGDTLRAVDIDNVNIRVLGPPPTNLDAASGTDSIRVSWDYSTCQNISGFEIFRREGVIDFVPDSCSFEIAPELGFKKVGEVPAIDRTFYDVKLNGLEQGVDYCYLVRAVFNNETPGIPSLPVCASLLQGVPALLKISVEVSHPETGEIHLAWQRPTRQFLDSLGGGAPYQYELMRANPGNLQNFSVIHTSGNLEDTTYVDGPLNTIAFPYTYQVRLYYTDNITGNLNLASDGGFASSTFLEVQPADNQNTVVYRKDAPWRNIEDSVFLIVGEELRFLETLQNSTEFLHEELQNEVSYTYQMLGTSEYVADSIRYITHNRTHVNSGIPLDTVPPCPPLLTVESLCDSGYNLLSWQIQQGCLDDEIVSYNLFYSPTQIDSTRFLESIDDPDIREYNHYSETTLAGCYEISAIDSASNESPRSQKICIDVCSLYKLPNVFSPNGDNVNDIYRSVNINNYVKEVDMKIYNRWGKLVYETTNPDISWDGRNIDNNTIVPAGVYYYVCDVYEPRITGVYLRSLTGFIHVYSTDDAKPLETLDP